MATDDRNELERLRRQLEAVTAERDRLLAENRRLSHDFERLPEPLPADPEECNRALFSPPVATLKVADTIPAVSSDSPLSGKIRLFRSLFRGREDVFARLWWSRKSRKIGYSPVCSHRWNPMLCGAPSTKCGDCPNRDFAPLSDGVIQYHLEGRHIIGIYPLRCGSLNG